MSYNQKYTPQKSSESTKKTIGKNSFIFLKGLLIFCFITVSLFHIFFDYESPKAEENHLVYKKLIKDRNFQQDLYLEQLHKEKINSKEYYAKVIALKELTNKQKETLNNKKRTIDKQFSFNGRRSFRIWIYLFGLVSLGMFFSCKSLFDDISKGSHFKFHFISLTGVFISCFWLIHLLFFTHKDFSNGSYIGIISISAVLSTAFTYFLIKYYNYKDQIIYDLIALIERIKKEHIQRVGTKAMYAEKNDSAMLATDSIKTNIEKFDKDVAETLKKI